MSYRNLSLPIRNRWIADTHYLTLGTYRSLFLIPRTLRIAKELALAHMHVLGKTGSGKSYFLAGLFLALQQAGLAVTLVDPHGDLAELVLSYLVQGGVYRDTDAFNRVVYLDLAAADSQERYLPFNFLDQPYNDHAMAELVSEACKRAWPELAQGAPTFENILKHSIIVLRQNGLPLTRLADLLTDTGYRNQLLERVTDSQVVRFFRLRMDQWGREAPLMKESTLNRADLLTLTPLLRYSLGSVQNRLDFRRILDEGRSVIINLAFPYPDARRLFGCLLTVGMESAALSRANTATRDRGPTHHLLLDEFSQFTAQSETALTRMLSETRKYGLFCVMAHQNWSQADERLRGALQNAGFEFIFKTGRFDAEYSARLLGWVNPMRIKHRIRNEEGGQRTHPTYAPMQEQWERLVQQMQYLKTGYCFVRLPNDVVHKVRIQRLPQLRVAARELTAVKEEYLRRYFERANLSTAPVPVVEASSWARITRRPWARR
jgi:Helicase HerA, central domain/TraM recognition site of TraD and TraG